MLRLAAVLAGSLEKRGREERERRKEEEEVYVPPLFRSHSSFAADLSSPAVTHTCVAVSRIYREKRKSRFSGFSFRVI